MGQYDAIIRNARLIDGSGAESTIGDVGVQGDRIHTLGSVSGDSAVDIDGTGLAVAPGFIDVHTHDDFAAILHPDMSFKVLGGVTTCVVGNCGMGAAPYGPASFMARAFHPRGSLPNWEGYAGYLDLLDARPASVNIAALVGHGTLRAEAMGAERGQPSGAEMRLMKTILHEGLDAGAVGLSTGLIYEPGRHAKTEEIVELAAEMAGTEGLYATHMRDEGSGLLESVREAIEIGERAGVPVQISHHKAAGRENWGLVEESLALITEAQAHGVDVHADQYPYTAGSTVLSAVTQNGAFQPARVQAGQGGLGHLDPADVVIASAPHHPEWEGRSIEDFAQEWHLIGQEAAERVLREEPMATVVIHNMSEQDVCRVMKHPSTMIGSDGIPSLEGRPHPRLYGTFARVLGHYSRELGLFTIEEAVHRMTGMAARKFRLDDRGLLREGAFADLVVFDPKTILDAGTYQDPQQSPIGVHYVFVNGTLCVAVGAHTKARTGMTLRRAGR